MMDHDNLPPDVSRLLDADRADVAPPHGARDRVRSRVLLTVGAAAAGTALAGTAHAAASTKATTTAASVNGLWAWAPVAPKVMAPLLIGSALVGGTVGLVQRAPVVDAPPPAMHARPAAPSNAPMVRAPVDPEPAPAVDEPAPTAMEPQPAARPPVERKVVRAAPRAVRSGGMGGAGLEEERQLLDDVRAGLAAGNTAHAWERLESYGRQHAHGQLMEEARALRVMLLMRKGDVEGARAAAADFHAAHPGSALGAAVDAALESPR